MKRMWLVVLMVISASLLIVNVAVAAATYPSVAGQWTLMGTQTLKGSLKGYGSGSTREPFYEDVTLGIDHSFWSESEYYGNWTQTNNKILINLNPTNFEEMVNDWVYSETGLDVYVEITGMSCKAAISKDGNSLSGGKVYVKFEIYYGGTSGKGTHTVSFAGSRNYSVSAAQSVSEEQAPVLVSSFGRMLIERIINSTHK